MPRRFCLVTTFYPPYHFGGDGMCVYRLAAALGRRGHEVDVIHSEDAYHLAHPGQPEVPFEDPPGVRRIMAAGEKAQEKKLAIISGTQYRHHEKFIQTIGDTGVQKA